MSAYSSNPITVHIKPEQNSEILHNPERPVIKLNFDVSPARSFSFQAAHLAAERSINEEIAENKRTTTVYPHENHKPFTAFVGMRNENNAQDWNHVPGGTPSGPSTVSTENTMVLVRREAQFDHAEKHPEEYDAMSISDTINSEVEMPNSYNLEGIQYIINDVRANKRQFKENFDELTLHQQEYVQAKYAIERHHFKNVLDAYKESNPHREFNPELIKRFEMFGLR